MSDWVRQTKQGVETGSFIATPTTRIHVHLHPAHPAFWVVSCWELGINAGVLKTFATDSIELAEKEALATLNTYMETHMRFFKMSVPED